MGEVPSWISACADVWNDNIGDLVDLIGEGRSEDEKQMFVDFHYLKGSGDDTIPCVTATGEWAFDRDVENKGRGDPGSIDARVQSIKRSGFIENRGGPWCLETSDAKIVDRYDVAHQATLLDGGKKPWESDPNHSSL